MYPVSQFQVVGSLVRGDIADVNVPIVVALLPVVIHEPHLTSVDSGDGSRCGGSAGRDVELWTAGREAIIDDKKT